MTRPAVARLRRRPERPHRHRSGPARARGLPETTYALLTARRGPLAGSRRGRPSCPTPRAGRSRSGARSPSCSPSPPLRQRAARARRAARRRGRADGARTARSCITATLAAQLAGIAAPVNASLSAAHLGELLRRSGARVLVAAGPELAPGPGQRSRPRPDRRARRAPGAATHRGGRRTRAVAGPARCPRRLPPRRGAAPRPARFAGTLPRRPIWRRCSTPAAPPARRSSPPTPTPTRWPTPGWWPPTTLFDAPTSTMFAALPLFHVNALVVTVLAPLFRGQQRRVGRPARLPRPRPRTREFWKLVEHYRIAAMSAVPTVYAALARMPGRRRHLQPALRRRRRVPAARRRAGRVRRPTPACRCRRATGSPRRPARARAPSPDASRPGSVGQRLPYQRMKAVRRRRRWRTCPAGRGRRPRDQRPDRVPRLRHRPRRHGHVLDGLGKLGDGWLDTGDLARVDDDGFVHLTGRAKDLIIRGGHNIDPAVIEDALLRPPAGRARPRPSAGPTRTPARSRSPTSSSARRHRRARTSSCLGRARVAEPAAAPKAVTVLDALPVTAVGKPYKLARCAPTPPRQCRHRRAGTGSTPAATSTPPSRRRSAGPRRRRLDPRRVRREGRTRRLTAPGPRRRSATAYRPRRTTTADAVTAC